jgi:lipoprotein-anchoring transpeptidase ErfK/SrfK
LLSGCAASPDKVKLYFTSGEQFNPVERDVSPEPSNIKPTVKALLDGPTPQDAKAEKTDPATTIPEGTRLEEVDVDRKGTAVVKVSDEFMKGVPAKRSDRTPSEQQKLNARVAQVTYTVTQFKNVRSTTVISGGVAADPHADRRDYAKPAKGPRPVKKSSGPKIPGTRQVQRRLYKLGYLPKLAIDGRAGYRTSQAVTAFQAWEGLDRDGTVGPQTTAALATAKRPRPEHGGPGRRIDVYRSKGVALLIRGGRVVRAIHVSTGGPGHATPSGDFKVFRKELRSWSVPFRTWLPYASYFNQGIAFHEYPDVPAYPASHGCARVPAPEAPVVYRFARLGTAVLVR